MNQCKYCNEKCEHHAMVMMEWHNYNFYANQCYPQYGAWITDHPFVRMTNLEYLEKKYEEKLSLVMGEEK